MVEYDQSPSVFQNGLSELKGMAKGALPMLGALTPSNPLTMAKSAYQSKPNSANCERPW